MSDKIHFQNIFVPGMQVANNRIPLPLANGNFWRAGDWVPYTDFIIGGRVGYWWHFSDNAVVFKPSTFTGSPLSTFFHVTADNSGYIVVDPSREQIHKYNLVEDTFETVSLSENFVPNSVPPNKNLPIKYLETVECAAEHDAVTQVEGKTLIDTSPYLFYRLWKDYHWRLWPMLYHTDTGNNMSCELEQSPDWVVETQSYGPVTHEVESDQHVTLVEQYTAHSESTGITYYSYDTYSSGSMSAVRFIATESNGWVFDGIFQGPIAISRYTDYGSGAVYKCDVTFWLKPDWFPYTYWGHPINWDVQSADRYTLTWRESPDFPGYLYLEPFEATLTFSYGPMYTGNTRDGVDTVADSHTITISIGGAPDTEEDLESCGRVGNVLESIRCYLESVPRHLWPYLDCRPSYWVYPDWRPVLFTPVARLSTEAIDWEPTPYDGYAAAELTMEFDMESVRVEFETQSYDMSSSDLATGELMNLVHVDEDLSASVDIPGEIVACAPETIENYVEDDSTGMFSCVKQSVYQTGFTEISPVIPSPTDADVIEHREHFGVNTGDAPHSNYSFFGVETAVYKSREGIELDFESISSYAKYSIRDDTGTFYFLDLPTRTTNKIYVHRSFTFDPEGEESKSTSMYSLGMYHGVFRKDGCVYVWESHKSTDSPEGAFLELHKYHGEDEVETTIVQAAEGMGAMTFYAVDNSLVHLEGNYFVHPMTNTKFNLASGESEMFVSVLPEGVHPHTFRGLAVSANKEGLHYAATKSELVGGNLFEGGGVSTAYPFTSFDVSSNPPGFYLQNATGFTLLHPCEFEPGASYYVSFESMPPTSDLDLYGVEVRFVYQSGWVVNRGMGPVEGRCKMGVASYDDEPEETVHAIVLCGISGNAKIDLSTVVCKKSTGTSSGSFFQLKNSATCTSHAIEGEGEEEFSRMVNANTGYYFYVE